MDAGTAIGAAEARHSVRQYQDKALDPGTVSKLLTAIDEINRESGLSVRLVTDDPKAFSGIMGRMSRFTNVPAYFSMIGKEDPSLNERVGYYGEELVLYAQSLGLNTCWAMVCGKKGSARFLKEGEKMVIGIAVGYGADQGSQHKSKPVDMVSNVGPDTPEWFRKGVEGALGAPTGMNKQAFRFEYKDERVEASYLGNWMTQLDLGIAKKHFELYSVKDSTIWI